MQRRMILQALFGPVLALAGTTLFAGQQELDAVNALIKSGQYVQAEEMLNRLQQQSPGEMAYLNNLAAVQIARGDLDSALQTLRKAVSLNQNFHTAQQNINSLYAFKASKAYALALDKKEPAELPALKLITTVEQQPPVQAIPAEVKNVEPGDTTSDSDIEELLQARLRLWADAWMQGDVKGYLDSYSGSFVPENRLAYNDWVQQRRYRLNSSKNVQVNYNQVHIYLGSDKTSAVMEFEQAYRSGSYSDRVIKQLIWTLEEGTWRISREREIEKL